MINAYSPDIVTANQTKFWFLRLRFSGFDVTDAPRFGSTIPIAQHLNIAKNTVFNRHLKKKDSRKEIRCMCATQV